MYTSVLPEWRNYGIYNEETFYTGGKQGGNAALKAMLTYMQDSRDENVTDEATMQLHSYVSRMKILPEVKNAYMTLDELLYYANMEEREEAVIDTMVQSILEGAK